MHHFALLVRAAVLGACLYRDHSTWRPLHWQRTRAVRPAFSFRSSLRPSVVTPRPPMDVASRGVRQGALHDDVASLDELANSDLSAPAIGGRDASAGLR